MDGESERRIARISRNAWYLRLYLWLWEAKVERTDFCKLFWGLIFAPPMLIVRVISMPFRPLIRAIDRKMEEIAKRRMQASERDIQERVRKMRHELTKEELRLTQLKEERLKEKLRKKKEREARRQQRKERLLGWIGSQADQIVGFCQFIWPILRYGVIGLAGLGAIGVGGLCIYGLYWVLVNATWVYLIVLVLAAFVGVVVGLALFFLDQAVQAAISYWATRFGNRVVKIVEPPVRWVGGPVQGGTLTFVEAIKEGAHAVKTRTCPIIDVIEEDEGGNRPIT